MSVWDPYLTDTDRRVFSASGYNERLDFGRRPALLVIDVTYAFVGHERVPIEESVKSWRNSCGERGWAAVDAIARLLGPARAGGVPVLYTAGKVKEPHGLDRALWRGPSRGAEPAEVDGFVGTDVVAEIAPRPEEAVIRKTRPSGFFGTPLESYLNKLEADSLIVCGGTTSGCVRATVVDGFSYDYRVAVVEEGTFDRGEASHALSLFDMDSKYADVVTLQETLAFLEARRAA